MHTLLQVLHKEYRELDTKLHKIADLIIAYGGEVPPRQGYAIPAKKLLPSSLSKSSKAVTDISADIAKYGPYPVNGTWKEKVHYILNAASVPLTAIEVGTYMKSLGEEKDIAHIQNMATQYCSSMAGDDTISVDKSSGFKNKYFLLPPVDGNDDLSGQ